MLLGTNSTDKNNLLLAKVLLPTSETLCDMSEYKTDAQSGELGLKRLEIMDSLPQGSEVLRSRVNPKYSWLVASKNGGYDPELVLYDLKECAGK